MDRPKYPTSAIIHPDRVSLVRSLDHAPCVVQKKSLPCLAPRAVVFWLTVGAVALEMDGSDHHHPGDRRRGGTNAIDNTKDNSITGRKRFGIARIAPEEGKKRVNYTKGDARRIIEEAVSLCEAMTLGYEVVLHGRRRKGCPARSSNIMRYV